MSISKCYEAIRRLWLVSGRAKYAMVATLNSVAIFFITPSISQEKLKGTRENLVRESGVDQIKINVNNTIFQHFKKSSQIVDVCHDEYFKVAKRYLAIPILPILDSLVRRSKFDTAESSVFFECTDGYRPSIKLHEFYQASRGFLAFKDLSDPFNKDWNKLNLNLNSPYYLVWANSDEGNPDQAWPFGIKAIILKRADLEFKTLTPSDDTRVYKGFVRFEKNCIKCHSINKIGGQLGPELNYPTNVTDYLSDTTIRAYIRNPKQFRYNARMPSFKTLDEESVDLILEYLKYVRELKLK